MNCLEILTEVCEVENLGTPGAAFSNSSPLIKRMLACMQQDLRYLASLAWPRTRLKREWVTIASPIQGTTREVFGTDVNPLFPMTMWNASTRLPLEGPLKMADYQMRVNFAGTTPNYAIALFDDKVYVLPTPPAGQNWNFIQQSRNLVRSATGEVQTKWQADSDTSIIDDEILVLGLQWRWKAALEMPFATHQALWADAVRRHLGEQQQNETISMTAEEDSRLDGPKQIWGVVQVNPGT